MNLLNGGIAPVTGADPNIDRIIASTLAAAGATVICNDLKATLGDAAADTIDHAGDKAFVIPADISDPQQARGLVERASRAVGLVDILVNNVDLR